jgi:hypothetical protein
LRGSAATAGAACLLCESSKKCGDHDCLR